MFDSQKPESAPEETEKTPEPTAPTVAGTYTIPNGDESVTTFTFYSDNTYSLKYDDIIAQKGTFTGTLAEGETITLTPTEVNFYDDNGNDNFLTKEQALNSSDPEIVEEAEAAFAPYTVTLTNSDDDPDPEDPPVIPPAATTVVATYPFWNQPTVYTFFNNGCFELTQNEILMQQGTYTYSEETGIYTATITKYNFKGSGDNLLTKEQALAALNNSESDVCQLFASLDIPEDQFESVITTLYATKDYEVRTNEGIDYLFPVELAE